MIVNANDLLVFDLGGVVARFTPQHRTVYLSKHTGLPSSEIELRLFESGMDAEAEIGRFDPKEILEVVRAALENRISEPELVTGWSRAFELNQQLLQRIARLPQRVALFSNNGPMLLHCCLAAPLNRINDVFNERIWSWELQAKKPSPAAFVGAVSHLGVDPKELVLFDDSIANVEQARRSGWRAEHVTDPETLFAN
jgi:HAD superfamily hydrolase (TIGR01509 family)